MMVVEVCPRSLSELQYSKQGAAAGRKQAVKRDEPSTASRAPPAGLPPVLGLPTHRRPCPFTHARLAPRQAPSPAVGTPRHTSNALHARDGRLITRYTIWAALLTPADSQHRRGQTIQGTRRTTRDSLCSNDSRRLAPAKGV